jgi:hypothetical protein
MNRRVYVVCQDIVPGVHQIQHTKMIVGQTTYQVDGGVDEGKAWCKVMSEENERTTPLKHSDRKFLGRSTKTWTEIRKFIEDYNSEHFPTGSLKEYGPLNNNCQKFVLRFSFFSRLSFHQMSIFKLLGGMSTLHPPENEPTSIQAMDSRLLLKQLSIGLLQDHLLFLVKVPVLKRQSVSTKSDCV